MFSSAAEGKKYSRLYLFHCHAFQKVDPCISTSGDKCNAGGLSHEATPGESQFKQPTISALLVDGGRWQEASVCLVGCTDNFLWFVFCWTFYYIDCLCCWLNPNGIGDACNDPGWLCGFSHLTACTSAFLLRLEAGVCAPGVPCDQT